jgi:hypothetical protein
LPQLNLKSNEYMRARSKPFVDAGGGGGKLKRCVVVGNGGGLSHRPLGSVIDRHSFVVRLNQG